MKRKDDLGRMYEIKTGNKPKTDPYMAKSNRVRRAADALPLHELADEVNYIFSRIRDTDDIEGKLEMRYFNHCFRQNMQKYNTTDAVWFGTHVNAYNCALESLLEYRKQGFMKKLYLQMKK